MGDRRGSPGRRVTSVRRDPGTRSGSVGSGARSARPGDPGRPAPRDSRARATARRPGPLYPRGRPLDGRPRAPLTRFQRLAYTHALMVAADAVMLVALASTVLSLDADAARTKVLLYQLTTLAPFTVLAPLIGPMIDRMAGGRRLVVQIAAVGRVLVSLLLASALDSLFLYPLALGALILKQTYMVSKSALVPSVASTDADFVEANSKLGVIAGLAAVAAIVPAAVLQHLSARATLVGSAGLFTFALVYATRLPREAVATRRPDRVETEELRSSSIVLGASALVLLRASVGFLQFHLFFWLRGEDADVWFGAAIAVGSAASMLGNAIGPSIRRVLHEEVMLICGLVFVAVGGIGCAIAGGRATAIIIMSTAMFGSAVGKLAFDSIVQRDAHDANHGRAFARFESRFQLAWVLAAIPPVIWTPPGQVGYAVVGAIAAFAAASYLVGMRAVRQGRPVPRSISQRAGQSLRRRIEERRTPSTGSPRPSIERESRSGSRRLPPRDEWAPPRLGERRRPPTGWDFDDEDPWGPPRGERRG